MVKDAASGSHVGRSIKKNSWESLDCIALTISWRPEPWPLTPCLQTYRITDIVIPVTSLQGYVKPNKNHNSCSVHVQKGETEELTNADTTPSQMYLC